jgi:archaellum biogenesis ATPase FlaH
MAIDHFLERSEGSVVLLDGVEYLISHNDFSSILTLLHDLNERVSLTNAVLLLPVDPHAIEAREFNLLKRDLRVLYPGAPPTSPAPDEVPPEPYVRG